MHGTVPGPQDSGRYAQGAVQRVAHPEVGGGVSLLPPTPPTSPRASPWLVFLWYSLDHKPEI